MARRRWRCWSRRRSSTGRRTPRASRWATRAAGATITRAPATWARQHRSRSSPWKVIDRSKPPEGGEEVGPHEGGRAGDVEDVADGVVLGLVEVAPLDVVHRLAVAVGAHAHRQQAALVGPLDDLGADDAGVGAVGLLHQEAHGVGGEAHVVVAEEVEGGALHGDEDLVGGGGEARVGVEAAQVGVGQHGGHAVAERLPHRRWRCRRPAPRCSGSPGPRCSSRVSSNHQPGSCATTVTTTAGAGPGGSSGPEPGSPAVRVRESSGSVTTTGEASRPIVDLGSPRLRWGYGTGPARRHPERRPRRRLHRGRPGHPGLPAAPGAAAGAREGPRGGAPPVPRQPRSPRRPADPPGLSPSLRLALDTTSLIGARTGVGTFTAELLARLAPRPELDVTAFAVTRRGARAMAAELPAGVTAVHRPMVARPLRWCWTRSDHPPIEWWTGTVDVVHGPNFVVPPARRAAEVVTVHDLTCVRFPEMCTPDVLQVPGLLRRALARGAWVHTVSEFVAAEVVEAFDVDPVPGGRDPQRRPGLLSARDARTAGGRASRSPGPTATCSPSAPSSPARTSPPWSGPSTSSPTTTPTWCSCWPGPTVGAPSRSRAAVAAARHGRRVRRLGWVDDRDPHGPAGRRRGRGLPLGLRGLRAAPARGAGRRHTGGGHPAGRPARGPRRRRRVGRRRRPRLGRRRPAGGARRPRPTGRHRRGRPRAPRRLLVGPHRRRPRRALPAGGRRPGETATGPTRACPKLGAPAPGLDRGPTSGNARHA